MRRLFAGRSLRSLRLLGKENRGYLLLVLVPLFLGLLLYLVTWGAMSREIRRCGELMMDSLIASVSNTLDGAARLADNIAQDPYVLSLLSAPGEDVDARAVRDALHSRDGLNRHVDSVYLISASRSFLADQYAVYTYESGFTLFNVVDMNLYLDAASVPEGWNIARRDYAVPYYVRQLPPGPDGVSAGTLVVILDNASFSQLLRENGADFCCIFNDRLDICSLPLAHEHIDWRSQAEVSRFLGKSVHCVYRAGERFSFLTAVSTREYYRPLQTILAAFLVYYLMVVCYGLWKLSSLARRRYARVSSLLEGITETPDSIAGYDELMGSIRQALEQYRDENQSGRELLQAKKRRYLLGGHSEERGAQLSACGIRRAKEYYVATFFISEFGAIWESEESAEQVEVTDIIFRSAFDRFSREAVGVVSVDVYPNYAAIFSAFEPEAARGAILDILTQVSDFLMESFQMKARCVISGPAGETELGRLYRETIRANDLVTALGSDAAVLFADDISSAPGMLLGGDYNRQLQVLMNALQLRKYELVPQMTDSLIRDCVVPWLDHPLRTSQRMDTVSTVLIEGVRQAARSPEEFAVLCEPLNAARRDPSATSAAVKQVFGQLAMQAGESGSGALTERAAAYIDEHLSDASLSLPMICEAVGCSVQHLSRLFRQEKNTTINEYIHDRRILKAEDLLSDPSLTVGAVAEAVGYVSMDTFTRNFRRRKGVTPTEFRGLLRG